jgi:hypothetical protein
MFLKKVADSDDLRAALMRFVKVKEEAEGPPKLSTLDRLKAEYGIIRKPNDPSPR